MNESPEKLVNVRVYPDRVEIVSAIGPDFAGLAQIAAVCRDLWPSRTVKHRHISMSQDEMSGLQQLAEPAREEAERLARKRAEAGLDR